MLDDQVTLIINGQNKASAAFKSAVSDTQALTNAVAALIQREKETAVIDAARDAVSKMSDAEKDAALAAAQLAAKQTDVRESVHQTGLRFTELQSAIGLVKEGFAAAGQVISQTFAIGREGAAVTQTAASFDMLLQKVGAAPDLLNRLQDASQGTVDEMRLMSSTATLLAGAQGTLATSLAESTPRLMEIAKAAQKLNPSLGDTTFLYESLATGIKRASPMILDNLGLTLKIGEANEKYAASLGKSAEELTAEEAKIALLNATLEAGDVLIQQVGGSTASAGDAIAEMDAAVKNATDAFKAGMAPAITSVAKGIADLINKQLTLRDALNHTRDGVAAGTQSYADYIKAARDTASANGYIIDADNNLINRRGFLVQANYLMTESMYDAIRVSQAEGNASLDMAERLRTATTATEDLAARQEELAAEQKIVQSEMEKFQLFLAGPMGEENKRFQESWDTLTKKADDLQKKIADLSAKSYLTQSQKDQLAALKQDFSDVTGKIKENADEHELATKRILLDILQQQLAMDGLVDAADAALIQGVAKDWGLIDNSTYTAYLKMEDYRRILQNAGYDAAAIRDAIAGIPTEKTVSVKVMSQYADGFIPGKGGGYANGGSFIVPPGYPNDSYSLGGGHYAQSGELVTVTPAPTTNIHLTAHYAYQSPVSLAADIKMLAALYGGR